MTSTHQAAILGPERANIPSARSETASGGWGARLLTIQPALVQIYSLARGYPDADIAPATSEELQAVKAVLDRAGVPSQVF